MKHRKHWNGMVLAAGATLQFPGMNRLVIDAGTCDI
jgi:hypothetical protein